MFALRKLVCSALLVFTPVLLVADDQAGAILKCKGMVSLNGAPSPDSSAIVDGDSVETTKDSVATITASGSNVIVQPASLLKFARTSIELQQGTISVATSNLLSTTGGSATVTPVANTWTEYEVSNASGVLDIFARKGGLQVNCGKESTTLAEGMQVLSDASGRCRRKPKGGAYPPANGNILNSPYLRYIGAAAGAGTLIWLLWPQPRQPESSSQP